MKRLFAGSATFAIAAAMAAAPALAASSTQGTIALTGSVDFACTVSVQDAGATLDLVDGSSNVKVGTVTENCNNANGYTITLSSNNSGVMVDSSDSKATAAYTVSYDTAEGQSLTSPVTISHDGQAFDVSHDVTVSTPGNSKLVAGSYGDTITISILAN